MEKEKNRMKTKADVEDYFDGDRIECLICGKWFKSLATHIVRIHGVTVDEYKIKFNLPWGRGLVANETRDNCSNAIKKRIAEGNTPFINFIGNPETMKKAQQAKKRMFRNYDIERVLSQGHEVNNFYKQKTEEKAVSILDAMESEQIPACYVCMLPDVPGLHNLTAACKRNASIRQRYEKIKSSLPSMIEGKTGMSRKEIKDTVMKLREEGKTTADIATDVDIGKTTVKRILRNEGAWKDNPTLHRTPGR